MKKRIGFAALTTSALLFTLPFCVFANSPPPDGIPLNKPAEWIFYLLVAFCGLAVTVAVEILAALVFPNCIKHLGTIAVTNVWSQLLMHVANVIFLRLGFYGIYVTAIVEVLVYAGEFLSNRHWMDKVPKLEVLIYTVAANTLSLLAGNLLLGDYI